jgi:hypothetical protein
MEQIEIIKKIKDYQDQGFTLQAAAHKTKQGLVTEKDPGALTGRPPSAQRSPPAPQPAAAAPTRGAACSDAHGGWISPEPMPC